MIAKTCYDVTAATPTVFSALGLDSTLQALSLYDVQIDSANLGLEVAQRLKDDPLLPGVILLTGMELAGMISRRRFLEFMSLPSGLDMFNKRALKTLQNFIPNDVLILSGDTLIVTAAKKSLQRNAESCYEPIVVEISPQTYRLLDVHQLLVAQSQIQELTIQLLQEQTQSQLLQTEKLASLGRMVAGVAHEIRNPVNCIVGNLPFLLNYFRDLSRLMLTYEADLPDVLEVKEIKEKIDFDFLWEDLPLILASIQVSSSRLTEIVSSLNSFSHLDESKRLPANLHECIDSTLLILNNGIKQGIEVIRNYSELPLVNCYSGQLSQVFMNIISNAIDALLETNKAENWRPRIEITTEILPLENPENVVITIADNGIGMSPSVEKRIFETFFTTKPVGKGTGLGLAISHQIVTQKHGGELRVSSLLNMGTQFQIILPLI